MIYDFDKEIERRGTNCVKWDEAEEGVLPLWVADMDFETAPCVQEAIRQRAQHGVYGYNLIPESFYDAIIWWNSHRHGWTPRREWMLYTSRASPLCHHQGPLPARGGGALLHTGLQLLLLQRPQQRLQAGGVPFDLDFNG